MHRFIVPLKFVFVLAALLSLARMEAQDNFSRGPQINDSFNFGQGGVGGRSNVINGPRAPAFFRPRNGGNSNWLQSVTQGSAVFDNGTVLAGIGADAGFGTLGVSLFNRLNADFQTGSSWLDGWKVGLGPLVLSNFSAGVGTFYTDFNTPTGIGDASGWSSVITLNANANLNMGPLSFGAQLGAFYLPMIDKWGYGTPSAILSFGSQFGQFQPQGSMGLGIKGMLAGWDWIVYDTFNASYASTNISDYIFDGTGNTNTFGSLSASGPGATAVDQVGRYQFGSGALLDRPANGTSRFQAPRFATNGGSLLSQDRSFFTNTIGTIAGRMLSARVRNFYWLQRDDFWATTKFTNFGNFIHGGTYADYQSGNPYINPYIGYEFGTNSDFASIHHVMNAGSYGYLSPNTTYFANLGWVWGTGNQSVNSTNTALYELIVSQSISSRMSHYVGGGRTITDPIFGERFIADYLTYGLNFQLSSNTTLQAVAGISNTYGELTQSGDAMRTFQGIRLTTTLGQSNVSLSAIHENLDFKGGGAQSLDQWIYKVLYGLPIGGARTTAYTGYQYIDRRATGGIDSFQEHLFLLYLTHSF
ncbi:MAG: hypothetical protein NTX35_12005 [Verrucomicrobia bacterium]|nr:hypothetical protein [Verrucomicrobiota bacterium]